MKKIDELCKRAALENRHEDGKALLIQRRKELRPYDYVMHKLTVEKLWKCYLDCGHMFGCWGGVDGIAGMDLTEVAIC